MEACAVGVGWAKNAQCRLFLRVLRSWVQVLVGREVPTGCCLEGGREEASGGDVLGSRDVVGVKNLWRVGWEV